ncbi:condensation domain-containing protein [Kitasatospora purpeofusca]|uniref:condensation domain-containing protein n=1 Tax=Kitasatospora purpeofusca TaxID=67352 RepID=UPI00224E2D9B|nr:condensation domain-containing protein [Kitasatospora purpeofusca]MCX4758427.1 condensation domain-containing protein [Kitasatospora purpeofusca]WSR31121.1 condensation domain-containing protein [Kitasatospora purpeofusca]WSR39156.1 condensation domain-containing protein [Kitasatospora purpeofusca]
MLQISVEHSEIGPGEAHRWHLVPLTGDDGPAPRRMTGYNQAKHFTVAQYAQSVDDPIRSYVAGSFELAGRVDLDALAAALLHLVRRHEVLRAVYQPLAGDLGCEVLTPDEVALKHVYGGPLETPAQVTRHLQEAFQEVDTLSWPLITMGAVVRPESTTVWFSCDHLVTDGLSSAIAINDIATAYRSLTSAAAAAADEAETGTGTRTEAATTPGAGSYLEFSRTQRRANRAMRADDPRLDHWRGFRDRNGGLFPRFPLDLGVRPGELYAPVAGTERLLDADRIEEFGAVCRGLGGRLSMGLLASVAIAVRELGGPPVYRGLMPFNERGRGDYAESMGWFINTLPIEFPVGPGAGLGDVIADAQDAYAEVQAHAEVHFVKAWKLLAPAEYATLRYWPYAVNFFSYIDCRRLPGADLHLAQQARMHVWVSGCNGILHWLHRTDEGLFVNTIHADTPQARDVNRALLDGIAGVLTEPLRA